MGYFSNGTEGEVWEEENCQAGGRVFLHGWHQRAKGCRWECEHQELMREDFDS